MNDTIDILLVGSRVRGRGELLCGLEVLLEASLLLAVDNALETLAVDEFLRCGLEGDYGLDRGRLVVGRHGLGSMDN